ncbi:hypothetical protein HAX54_022336, partial [Datura stramonium]|nr:hypothetical protein [Datura stramonium]
YPLVFIMRITKVQLVTPRSTDSGATVGECKLTVYFVFAIVTFIIPEGQQQNYQFNRRAGPSSNVEDMMKRMMADQHKMMDEMRELMDENQNHDLL